MKYKRIAQIKTPKDLHEYTELIGVKLPFDEHVLESSESPLCRKYTLKDGFTIGNRFCVQPMEGWDGTLDGKPTKLTRRRWCNFGKSGAKLIWGGEAVAVEHAGRANPHQLLINDSNVDSLAELRTDLVSAHKDKFQTTNDLLVGLQLTHSGRFSRPDPDNKLKPVIAYHHPYLDEKFGINADYPIVSDSEIGNIIHYFIDAAYLAYKAGFQFVDIKHCHGYLGHELLTAYLRPGPYGGSFENRTRFLKEIITGIRERIPNLRIGVRISAFDFPPFKPNPDTRIGEPVQLQGEGNFWFGSGKGNPLLIDLDETRRFLQYLESMNIELVNVTAGSPYYVPHIQRPALFPPSDGYRPPEDPLVGVTRQIIVAWELKTRFPGLAIVGTAYSYLQEWLLNVAQHVIRHQMADFIGLGRLLLSYPTYPADFIAGKPINRKFLCRTFSDCTTAPRNGLVSGCYPLDDFYKQRPEAEVLAKLKRRK
jgi:2,4-dienoyl-CoA reductase-like NADH-dependent reductase (Old Yellow Enzyme family)